MKQGILDPPGECFETTPPMNSERKGDGGTARVIVASSGLFPSPRHHV